MDLKKSFLYALALVALSALGVYAFQNPAFKQTVALATTVKPETFTELYLENHQKLDRTIAKDKVHTFSFTIHNLEYQTMTYPYEVSVEDNEGNKAEILKDIVRLKHDEYRTIPVMFQTVDTIKRAKVTVNLINKKQEIHYWIGEENK